MLANSLSTFIFLHRLTRQEEIKLPGKQPDEGKVAYSKNVV